MRRWPANPRLWSAGALALAVVMAAPESGAGWLESAAEWTAVTGYEGPAHETLRSLLPEGIGLEADHVGNLVARFGPSGAAPRTVITAPIDEPGFVVSHIDEDGYLRLQSVHRRPPGPLWNQWHQGRKVVVQTGEAELVGAVTAPSVHLRRGRRDSFPGPVALEDLYVDIGADDPREAAALGVRLLDPVAYRKRVVPLSGELAGGPGLGSRWGAAVLIDLAHLLAANPPSAGVALVWLGQEALGRKGADRAARETAGAGEVVQLAVPPGPGIPDPGGGPVLWVPEGSSRRAPDGWQTIDFDPAETPKALYTGGPDWGDAEQRWITVPVRYAGTTAEVVSLEDVRAVARLLASEVAGSAEGAGTRIELRGELDRSEPGGGEHAETASLLARLVTTPGLSGHEGPVAEVVRNALPEWARELARLDEAGNLLVELGRERRGPRMAFVAHMDEIGYEAARPEDDGRLRLARRGGFLPSVFEAHPAVARTPGGPVTGVIAPRPGYAQSDEESVSHEELRFDLGAAGPEEAAVLVPEGSPILPLKEFHRLGPHRASARSFDDRVGCAALLLALGEIDPSSVDRPVVFAWSVAEEVGLVGAKHLSETLPPLDYVFPVDTFVTSDSPLESPRFAHAPLGRGAVLRALDNSNVTPMAVVRSIEEIAERHDLPLQYGVTGGGNDGAVFTRYGAVDVPISWPMRNSHTPAEVIDLRDVEALARLVRLLALEWEAPPVPR